MQEWAPLVSGRASTTRHTAPADSQADWPGHNQFSPMYSRLRSRNANLNPSAPRVTISCSWFWLDVRTFLPTGHVSMIIKCEFSQNLQWFPNFLQVLYWFFSWLRIKKNIPKKCTVRKPFQEPWGLPWREAQVYLIHRCALTPSGALIVTQIFVERLSK